MIPPYLSIVIIRDVRLERKVGILKNISTKVLTVLTKKNILLADIEIEC